MFSILNSGKATGGWRRACGFVLLAACGVLGGCQHYSDPEPDRLITTPMTIDPAMQRRDWPVTTAYYANTATIAGPRGFNYQPESDLSDVSRGFWEPMLALGQIVWLPIDLVVNPQWESRAYYPVRVDPTYHAVPALDVNRDSHPN
jgi:hypothetical protein